MFTNLIFLNLNFSLGVTMKNLLFILLILISPLSMAGGCGGDHEHEHDKEETTENDTSSGEA